MKINFALLGLVTSQSGDDRWVDTSYDYDVGSDRWSNENQYSLDEANAGITFGVMARVTKQQNAKHFQKALKLSCWNSNMIRDMNNDNKFSVYFNDQVEYKRFQPGMNTQNNAASPGSVAGGTVDTVNGRDDLSWLYAVGDLRTGMNHQYGFEHGSSDPYDTAVETNRLGANGSANDLSRNNNRLRQVDELEWAQSYTSGQGNNGNTSTKTLIDAHRRIQTALEETLYTEQAASATALAAFTTGDTCYDAIITGNSTCNANNTEVIALGVAVKDLAKCMDLTEKASLCAAGAAGIATTVAATTATTGCFGTATAADNCYTEYTDFTTARDALFDSTANTGCASDTSALNASCTATTTNSSRVTDLAISEIGELTTYISAKQTEGIAEAAVANAQTNLDTYGRADSQGISVSDPNHSIRPDGKWSYRKWGYQSDNVERAQSYGYDANTVVYHFGHHDNKDNQSNRPNMRYGAQNAALDENTPAVAGNYDAINMHAHEFDFHGFKDDWRYSLRMGGCLYEAARWVYDESSFHRTGRLTYTDDTLFMDDPFNPMDGTDIFGAHQYAAHTGGPSYDTLIPNISSATTTLYNQQTVVATQLAAFTSSTCYTAATTHAGTPCSTANTEVIALGDAVKAFSECMGLTAKTACAAAQTTSAAQAASGCIDTSASSTNCYNEYNTFISARNAVYDATNSAGCAYDSTNTQLVTNCTAETTVHFTNITDLDLTPIAELTLYLQARELEGQNSATLANAQLTSYADVYDDLATTFNDNASTSNDWVNAGMTNTQTSEISIGDCDGSNGGISCQYSNVATPSSGGVFADVHWVHVFNAHIFPLQDVGYYQYDQTLGLGNINENNDSITSRDGYGYNIYKAVTGSYHVMRDVWGVAADSSAALDTANNYQSTLSNSQTVADQAFHAQYGTFNVGDPASDGTTAGYVTADNPGGSSTDIFPILTKTRRKIEDFNVVMANPTYEGHGFLNFVATYHDHTENYEDQTSQTPLWIRQVGKRFLSTIGGLTTASNTQRNVCRAVKDGIDSYRMNGLMPVNIGSANNATGGHAGDGHDDPYLAPLGPGPAGNYGNGQRCGAAMYENFGDWFLRPAQTYSAYNTFTNQQPTAGIAASSPTTGWNSAAAACTNDTQALCLENMASYNYWAFILSEGYEPIANASGGGTTEHKSAHELWRNGSLHYDRRGSAGAIGAAGATANQSNSSGRGFAISSFPHNELGKDFRFNIRTLHNMGNGVAKQYYQIAALTAETGIEYGQDGTYTDTLRTSNLRTTETVWSYYFYAVDTIKIAFPEFVARVNHCSDHSHRNDSHCVTDVNPGTTNGNPNQSDHTNGLNISSAYPGYRDNHPYRRLGFQDIIIDGVTMKKTDNQYDSRATSTTRQADGGAGNWHKQYHLARGLREDDHTRATLHYLDTEFSNEDSSLNETNATNAADQMCGAAMANFNMGTNIIFFGPGGHDESAAGSAGNFQGYTDSYQPLKPCASWCAMDLFATDVAHGSGVDPSREAHDNTNVTGKSSLVANDANLSRYGGICGRVLRIDGLLQTYDELHNRQYGTIQEIWIQLQYAYQESLDNSERTTSNATCDGTNTSCAGGAGIRKVQSPFPNVFFSAPEVVDIRGFCPSSNMKCRGYMSDQHQPYGGARKHIDRVHWNNTATRGTSANAFGSNQVHGTAQSGNDWTIDRDFRGDSKWPWNYHSYNAGNDASNNPTGISYGGGAAGTTYNSRDLDHDIYTASAPASGKK